MFKVTKGGKELVINADFTATYDNKNLGDVKVMPANDRVKKLGSQFAGAIVPTSSPDTAFVLTVAEYNNIKPIFDDFAAKRLSNSIKRQAAIKSAIAARQDDQFGVGDADACEIDLKGSSRDFGNSIDETESY
jgi:hypothetical protein